MRAATSLEPRSLKWATSQIFSLTGGISLARSMTSTWFLAPYLPDGLIEPVKGALEFRIGNPLAGFQVPASSF